MGMAVAELDQDASASVAGFNGARFSRSRHILPELLAQLWQARDAARREHNTALAQAIKILMNSFYGVLGSPGCRFFDPRLASSITLRGHAIIRDSKAWIEERGYRVIYGDTDSLFVWVEQVLDEDKVAQLGQQLADDLNFWWRDRLAGELGLVSRLEVQFETHFLRFLMPTIRGTGKGSKKRYAGTVRVAPGNSPEAVDLVFKGLETVRSDWTPLARHFQQTLYRKVFADEPVDVCIRATLSDLLAGSCDEQLIYRKRLRQPLDAYERNVPPHVQAARKALAAGARPDAFRRGRAVEYLVTTAGPEALGFVDHPPDYQHYREKQLEPVADGILFFLGTSFSAIVDGQIALF
jgi:DNA polymerase-2